jgi:hypothetical protein
MTTAIALEMSMLTDQLSNTTLARAEQDTKPVRDLIERVRGALDRYEHGVIERAQRRLTRTMLLAIGHSGELTSAVPEEYEADDTVELLSACHALTSTLQPPVETIHDVPVQAPLQTQPCPPPPESAPASVPAPDVAPVSRPLGPAPTAAELQAAKKLIDEVSALEGDWAQQPAERLRHHLQALAAEARQQLSTYPSTHDLRWHLAKLPSKLHVIHRDAHVVEFVKGFSSNTSGDWAAIAKQARRAVQEFDQRLARRASPKKPSLATMGDVLGAKLRVVAPEVNPNAARWPGLRAATADKKLLLIGGTSMKPERIKGIQERAGITMAWEGIDKHAPRQVESLVRRIAGGNVAACLFAEGMMSHKDFYRMEASCKSTGVPYAFCDKAGALAVEQALDVVEGRFSDKA